VAAVAGAAPPGLTPAASLRVARPAARVMRGCCVLRQVDHRAVGAWENHGSMDRFLVQVLFQDLATATGEQGQGTLTDMHRCAGPLPYTTHFAGGAPLWHACNPAIHGNGCLSTHGVLLTASTPPPQPHTGSATAASPGLCCAAHRRAHVAAWLQERLRSCPDQAPAAGPAAALLHALAACQYTAAVATAGHGDVRQAALVAAVAACGSAAACDAAAQLQVPQASKLLSPGHAGLLSVLGGRPFAAPGGLPCMEDAAGHKGWHASLHMANG